MNLAMDKAPADVQELAREWPLVFMFKLPPGATIVVVGSYEGRLIALLRSVYPDFKDMHGYEPQYEACRVARERFKHDGNIGIHNYGLKTPDMPARMRMGWVGSVNASLMGGPGRDTSETFEFNNAAQALEHIDKIDLMVMNIEGAETELLPHIKKSHVIDRIDRIAVQFHPNTPTSINPLHTVYAYGLGPSHRIVVDQFPQWVYWVKSDA